MEQALDPKSEERGMNGQIGTTAGESSKTLLGESGSGRRQAVVPGLRWVPSSMCRAG